MESLSRNEVDRVLTEVGYGFLGFARENSPYVLPMSFGYDGENLYFQMNSQGRKFEYIDGSTPVCLTVFTVDPETEISRSVLVEGELREVPAEKTEAAYEALATTANFGTDLSLWGVPLRESDPTLFVLRPEDVSGRMFGER